MTYSLPQTAPHSPARLRPNPILLPVCEFVLLALALAALVQIIGHDPALVQPGGSEGSHTEAVQALLLFVSVLAFALRGWRAGALRGGMILLASFFACLLIRESDALFDRIAHGFWAVPAVLVALGGVSLARLHRPIPWQLLARDLRGRHFTTLAIGLLVVLVFSRLFGTGTFWQSLLGPAYDPAIKTAVQEGLELLGYLLIAYGAVLPLLLAAGQSGANKEG